ncbi:MAG TPA: HAMP domain-containing sensor histidine kinase [Ignavibacteriaceae bacterium]|nr:HAMP domain-containing sensor histidine kinase [Ignavibacteriaceae bacterium]
MKKSRIKIIIIIMAVTVLGLIAVQLYWVSNAFKVEQQRFESNVIDALSSTVKKVDKLETASIVINNISVSGDKNGVAIYNEDTLKNNIYYIKKSDSSGSTISGFKYNVDLKKLPVQIDTTKTYYNYFTWKDDTVKKKNEIWKFKEKVDSVMVIKKKSVSDIFNQLLTVEPRKPVTERVRKESINEILLQELDNKGINTEFEWGIKEESRDSVYYCKNENKEELLNSEFRAKLFPDDLFGTGKFLLVYFPNQSTYILRNISLMLGISALIIIAIIYLFYKTISLLIRQKKITEIKNDLINNITHEFKTPISSISLACESLSENQIINDKNSIVRYAKMISDENNRLKGMVENLLNTASLEKDDYHIEYTEFNIHLVIEELIENYKQVVENRNGKILTDLKAEDHLLNGDKFHITGVLNNLIDNAVKFTNENPEILIETINENNFITISISDNGIGIAKDKQDLIFETFYRVSTGNVHDVKGYGIGLSYVKKMIRAHNGKILVNSKPGKGSHFSIYLPLNKK